MDRVNEKYIVLEKVDNILETSTKYVNEACPELSKEYAKHKIMERERKGSTFIGNNTIILHVISNKVEKETAIYFFCWKSHAGLRLSIKKYMT